MRRILFLTLGALEVLVGLVLLSFAWQLPGPEEVHDGVGRVTRVTEETSGQVGRLGKYDEGLERLDARLQADRLGAMRDGFKSMEDALETSAGQVERMAGFTYPVVKMNGLKPVVEQKRFWPEGEQIAADLRKAAKG